MEAFVLNYNGGEKIVRCLSLLSREIDKITLVDNASTDSSVELVKKRLPKVKVVRGKENKVARAFNEPVMGSDSDWVLLLIGDMMATKGFMEPLLKHRKSDVLAISPRIVGVKNETEWGPAKLSFRFGRVKNHFSPIIHCFNYCFNKFFNTIFFAI